MPAYSKKPMGKIEQECVGPSCKGCSAGDCYAKGGIVGVHEQSDFGDKGVSVAGRGVREGDLESAKSIHQGTLDDMKAMPKPKLADGGEVDDDMDGDIHDMLGQELLGAIESKDHKKIWEGLEALVLSVMSKEQ